MYSKAKFEIAYHTLGYNMGFFDKINNMIIDAFKQL